jgi:putative transposase
MCLYDEMEEKYKNKYRTTSARLKGWDYGSQGLYFITICTKDRVHYFGEIIENPVDTEIQKTAFLHETEIGNVAHDYWLQISKYFPFVELDEFVIMPDHIHGVLFINKPNKTDWQPNKFGVQIQNLAVVIRGYKSAVKKYANENAIGFAWQAGYYDRVIRNEKEYQNIGQYIYNNPEQWLLNSGVDDDDIFPL